MENERRNSSFPLLFAGENEPVLIDELKGGQEFRTKCINLGIVPGRRIELVRNNGGVCLISVNDSRIMMGQGMLNRIMVSRN